MQFIKNIIKTKISVLFAKYAFLPISKSEYYKIFFNQNSFSGPVLKKTIQAFKIAKFNNNVFDRDGILFIKKNFNFFFLNHLKTLINSQRKVTILDFGCSTCNLVRNHKFLLYQNKINWICLDNEKIINFNKTNFKLKNFKFFSDLKLLKQFIKKENINIDIIHLGSVLQYIDDINKITRLIDEFKIRKILIDRQPILLKSDKFLYFKQTVPFFYYKQVYACKIYTIRKLVNFFNKKKFYLKNYGKALGQNFKYGKYMFFYFTKSKYD